MTETLPKSKEQLKQEKEALDTEIWDIQDHLYERMMARAAIMNILKGMDK